MICEFLDSLGDAPPLFPVSSAARWRALKFQAMGDGILDAAVPCRGELARPKEAARDAAIARYKAAMSRTVDALEADPPHRHVDIGSIAVACALGYLDFRYAADPWRPGHPKLAAWYEEFSEEPGHRPDRAEGMIDLRDPAADAASVIAALDLRPHPEGGHYRETWRDIAGRWRPWRRHRDFVSVA